jgi:hypothetical protein
LLFLDYSNRNRRRFWRISSNKSPRTFFTRLQDGIIRKPIVSMPPSLSRVRGRIREVELEKGELVCKRKVRHEVVIKAPAGELWNRTDRVSFLAQRLAVTNSDLAKSTIVWACELIG